MSPHPLSKTQMLAALKQLDSVLTHPMELIIGGGGALVLAHGADFATMDIDAVPKGADLTQIDGFIKKVATDLGIQGDWLNPYFSTFTHTLPEDYGTRLKPVFEGSRLKVLALSKEDLLIMKCFAGRKKDIPHIRFLIKKKTDIDFVESHVESLIKRKIPGAHEALDFLDEAKDM